MLRIARIYDERRADDGVWILVDRLWPRGVSKDAAPWDEWRKDLAPSSDLRKAFHAGDMDREGFRAAYLAELDGRAGPPPDLPADAVLVTAARGGGHVAILLEWLRGRAPNV